MWNSGNQLNIQNYVKTWIRGNADINFSKVQNKRFSKNFCQLITTGNGFSASLFEVRKTKHHINYGTIIWVWIATLRANYVNSHLILCSFNYNLLKIIFHKNVLLRNSWSIVLLTVSQFLLWICCSVTN